MCRLACWNVIFGIMSARPAEGSVSVHSERAADVTDVTRVDASGPVANDRISNERWASDDNGSSG